MFHGSEHHYSEAPNPEPVTAVSSDTELIKQIQFRNERALTLLVQRHGALLHSVISRVLNDEADADEVLQEVIEEIWKNAANFSSSKGQVVGWLITLARRRAIDAVRRRLTYCRAKSRYHEYLISDGGKKQGRSVESQATMGDLRVILAAALNQLPTAQREALRLHIYSGLSQREVAAKTGAPLGTAKMRIELAIKKVSRMLLSKAKREEWTSALVQ